MRNSNYLNKTAINKIANSKASKELRKLFTWNDLTRTKTGMRRKILSTSSYKFDMKNGKKITTKGMYLSPANEATSYLKSIGINNININMCPNATKLCIALCLKNTGQMIYSTSEMARIYKTLAFIAYPEKFCNQLFNEMADEAEDAEDRGEMIQFRFDGTSDQLWEEIFKLELFREVMPNFNVAYGYTKRLDRNPNDWYHMTYSVSDNPKSYNAALKYLAQGRSVAIVVDYETHKHFTNINHPFIIDGDLSDHRPQDEPGSIVLLKFKGKGAAKITGTEEGFIKNSSYVAKMLAAAGGLIQKVRTKETAK